VLNFVPRTRPVTPTNPLDAAHQGITTMKSVPFPVSRLKP
jgi:hypothetical protein